MEIDIHNLICTEVAKYMRIVNSVGGSITTSGSGGACYASNGTGNGGNGSDDDDHAETSSSSSSSIQAAFAAITSAVAAVAAVAVSPDDRPPAGLGLRLGLLVHDLGGIREMDSSSSSGGGGGYGGGGYGNGGGSCGIDTDPTVLLDFLQVHTSYKPTSPVQLRQCFVS